MHGDMYKMDDELSALLIETHRNVGFLEGLLKYAPNKNVFSELMLLKECTYSLMVDYDGPSFQEVLVSRGGDKGDIARITKLELAYKAAMDRTISAPDLSELCGSALYGDVANKPVDIRDKQTFLLGVRTNLKSYNPTAPDAVLPALVDISAYLYNDKDTDPLIKAVLVHYQFEMIHPFERYNGIVGRIIVQMALRDISNEPLLLICLSEYFYHNKNEYFDLLQTTQYSGGYIRWIKFFVDAVGKAAKRSVQLLIQYEAIVVKDKKHLKDIRLLPKSVWIVYDYLKLFPVTSISHAAKQLGSSFNSIQFNINININGCARIEREWYRHSKNDNVRNRIWEYASLTSLFIQE